MAISGSRIALSLRVTRAIDSSGSTLIEAVVAITILATAVVSLAGLASVAVRTIALTRERTMAAILASQKLEELSPASRALSQSSPGAARHDEAGFVEYLDAAGAVVGTGATARGVVYVRRWAVSPLAADTALNVILVAVSPCRRVSASARECGVATGTVRLATVRSSDTW
jgi:Tfp pilus assembly protein PilV